LRVVHYYRDLTRPSGVTAAIRGWQRETIAAGVESIALHNDDPGSWELPHTVVPHSGSGRQGQKPHLTSYLKPGDVLVLHEGWVTANYAAARQARRMGVPYIVVPHGVYEPQVMAGLKFANLRRWILETQFVKGAAASHIFYQSEASLVEAIWPAAVTFALPTGFESADSSWTPGGEYLAWFGRYDLNHKGLDRLLFGYALVPTQRRLPLKLRGIDYNGGKVQLIELVRRLGLTEWVDVGPPLAENEKAEFLCSARAFVFPSRWESQGIALIEALAMGVPALVSDSIQLSGSLMAANAALVSSFGNPAAVAAGLEEVASADHLSASGQEFVLESLNWSRLAALYKAELERIAFNASNS